MPESELIALRAVIRKNIKPVMDYIIRNHVVRVNGKAAVSKEPNICMFCGNNDSLTKEHVIPRWIFEKKTDSFFNITINGQNQTYNKTTIPACQKCNAELLNSLEHRIQLMFENADLKNRSFNHQESEDLIRWLEVIDYKFQILNITKKFLSSKKSGYIPYLKDFPLYMLLQNKEYSPSQVVSEIRHTLKRVSIKDKMQQINSLVIFSTSNESYHFFHTLNEFIFLELPKYGIAIFYFYTKIFDTNEVAHMEAMKIIKEVY